MINLINAFLLLVFLLCFFFLFVFNVVLFPHLTIFKNRKQQKKHKHASWCEVVTHPLYWYWFTYTIPMHTRKWQSNNKIIKLIVESSKCICCTLYYACTMQTHTHIFRFIAQVPLHFICPIFIVRYKVLLYLLLRQCDASAGSP